MKKIPVFNIGKRTFNGIAKDENGKDIDLIPKRSIGIEERKARILLKAYPRDLSTTGLNERANRDNTKKANELKKRENDIDSKVTILKGKEKELDDREKMLNDIEKDIDEFKKREKDLELRIKALDEREKALEDLEKELEERKIENIEPEKEGNKNAKG